MIFINLKEFLYSVKKFFVKLKKQIKFIIYNFPGFIVYYNQKDNYRRAHLIPDKIYLKFWYKNKTGQNLNIKNPKKLNEKLQWLKLYDRKELYNRMVDKFEVKKYISDVLGHGYTIPTIGIWDSFDEINFDSLPNQFVLKCTHDSGSIVICKDKTNFDFQEAKEKLLSGLTRNYFWKYREWPYKDVKPRIICEKYLYNSDLSALVDYKFYCFGGEPRYFMFSVGEAEHNVKNHKFDMNLNSIDYLFKKTQTINANDIIFPENINDMIDIAKKLCVGFPHLRVDMYNIDGKIFVGELTLYSGAGILKIDSEEYAQMLADYIELDF